MPFFAMQMVIVCQEVHSRYKQDGGHGKYHNFHGLATWVSSEKGWDGLLRKALTVLAALMADDEL